MSDIWSTIFLLISSGTLLSKQRLPASIWNIGSFAFWQKLHKELLVSPSINNPSGFTLSKNLSLSIIIWPIESAESTSYIQIVVWLPEL